MLGKGQYHLNIYGGYFRMQGPEPYLITAQIQRPGVPRVIETRFEYKAW